MIKINDVVRHVDDDMYFAYGRGIVISERGSAVRVVFDWACYSIIVMRDALDVV